MRGNIETCKLKGFNGQSIVTCDNTIIMAKRRRLKGFDVWFIVTCDNGIITAWVHGLKGFDMRPIVMWNWVSPDSILFISHSIGILFLFIGVWGLFPLHILLLLQVIQAVVWGSCFHIFCFRYMVAIRWYGTHCESSRLLEVLINRSLILLVLGRSFCGDSSSNFSCQARPSGSFQMGWSSIVFYWLFLFLPIHEQPMLLPCHWSFVSSSPWLLDIWCGRMWWGWRLDYHPISIQMGCEFVLHVSCYCVWTPMCLGNVANLLGVMCNR